MPQATFSATDYTFRWAKDSDGEWWYEYDPAEGAKIARRERDAYCKQLKAEGYRPRKFSLGAQLRSFGGIGSGYPHIEVHSKCFGVNW